MLERAAIQPATRAPSGLLCVQALGCLGATWSLNPAREGSQGLVEDCGWLQYSSFGLNKSTIFLEEGKHLRARLRGNLLYACWS